MQRDMKIGIALGVALVGIVAAMFYRREPERTQPAVPALNDPAGLDQEISENARMPYINGLDEYLETAPSRVSPNPRKSPPEVKSDPQAAAYAVPDFVTKDDEAEHRAFLSGKPTPAPDPLPVSGSAEKKPADSIAARAATADPIPAHNRDWLPSGTAQPAPAPARRTSAADASTSARTHVTQPGDTLTNLAARYLGNSNRYRELYEANKRVLRTPDNLPEGVTLVIPEAAIDEDRARSGGGAAAPARQTPARAASLGSSAPSVSGETASGPLRFAPARGGALSAGRSTARDNARPGPSRDRRIDVDGDPFQ